MRVACSEEEQKEEEEVEEMGMVYSKQTGGSGLEFTKLHSAFSRIAGHSGATETTFIDPASVSLSR